MKIIKLIFRTLPFALFAFVLSGQAMAGGNVSGGRYTSPLKNFSLPVPSGMGVKIDEAGDDFGGIVSFHDDFGNLRAISYLRLPPEIVEIFDDAAQRDFAYRSYLYEALLPEMFVPVSADTKVLHEEFLGQDAEREFLAVINIPEGSAMMDMGSGKRFDSTRALLIFETAGFIYTLHYELRGLFQGMLPQNTEFSLDDEKLESARGALHGFRKTIEFR